MSMLEIWLFVRMSHTRDVDGRFEEESVVKRLPRRESTRRRSIFPIHSGMVSKLFSLRKRMSNEDNTSRQVGNVDNPSLFRSSNFKRLNCVQKVAVWRVSFQTELDDR